MEERLYHLWLGMVPEISNAVFARAIDFFGGAKELWEADEDELKAVFTEKQMNILISSRASAKVKELERELEKKNIKYTFPGRPDYPVRLLDIPDRPNLLFYRGNIQELNKRAVKNLAVVGSRKASSYGLTATYNVIKGLQGYELNIISGLAYGIDVKAHLTALDMGLFTAAVLGCGIDKVYPESNRSVYERMIENGVIISEYAPGIPPLSWHFPVRNRIISGLSDGVLLIEAKEKSGSLITADQALEQGREVFAIPGRISDATSAGCNMLIRQGAVCITKAEDIASELMLNSDKSIKKKHLSKIPLAPMEKIVYSCVRLESKHIDDICRESGVSTSEVLSVLFELKRKNLIWEPVRNYFVRNT